MCSLTAAYRPITVRRHRADTTDALLLASHEYRGQAEASYPMIVDAARQCKLDYRKLYQAINKDKTVGGYYWRWAVLGNGTSVEKVMPC